MESRRNTGVSLFLILLSYFMASFFKVCANIVIPLYQERFALSSGFSGFISSAYFLTYTFMQLAAGPLSRRFGSHRVIAAGFTLSTIGTLILAFPSNGLSILIARLLMGIGLGPTYVATLSFMTDNYEGRTYALMGGVSLASGGLGSAFAFAPLRALVNAFGTTATLAGLAAVTQAMALAMLGLSFSYLRGRETQADGNTNPLLLLAKGVQDIMKSKPLVQIFLLWFLYSGIQHSYQGLWSASWFSSAFPASTALAGYSSTLVSIGIVAGTLLSENIKGRSTPLYKAAIAYEAFFTSAAVLLCITHVLKCAIAPYLTLAADLSLGLGIGLMNIQHISYVRRLATTEENATVLGVINAAGSLAAMLFQWLSGVSVDIFQSRLATGTGASEAVQRSLANSGFTTAYSVYAALFLICAASAIHDQAKRKLC